MAGQETEVCPGGDKPFGARGRQVASQKKYEIGNLTSVKFLKDHYEKASPEPAAGDRHGNPPVALGCIQAAIMLMWHDLCFIFA
jgi:hypothetical protein